MFKRGFFIFFSDSMNMEVASLKKMKNNDVLLTLPGTLKVRDIGWLSIWCKRFTVNYGEVYIPSDLEIPEKVVSTVQSRFSDNFGLRKTVTKLHNVTKSNDFM